MAANWPSSGADPPNLKEHVTFLHEACTQLQAVQGCYTAIPTAVIGPIIDSTVNLLSKVTCHLDEQPETQTATQTHHLFKEQRGAQLKDHEAIKTASEAATASSWVTTPAGTRVASCAQMAATAGLTPDDLTPQRPVLSSSPSSTPIVDKGNQVIVKLYDVGLAQRLREYSATQLKDGLNDLLQEDPKEKNVKIVAAHQLRSGDIEVIADSLSTAVELQTHVGWVKGIGPRAEVVQTGYGVIVPGIPVNTVNIQDQQGMIQRVLAENYSVIPDAHILNVALFRKDVIGRWTSLVVKFSHPEMANAIIHAGFLWGGTVYPCGLYDRSCRIQQCLRCYCYGHIAAQCDGPQTCGHCAGGHESNECTAKNIPGFTPLCTICKGSHEAWSRDCSERQKEIRRVTIAKLTRSHYWPTPAYQANAASRPSTQIGPGPTSSTSEPTQPSEDGSSPYQPDVDSKTLRARLQAGIISPPFIPQTQPGSVQPMSYPQWTATWPTLPVVPTLDTFTPIAPGATMMAPEMEREDDFDTDKWQHHLDLSWMDAVTEEEHPPSL
ncbi:hypothetical protein AYL99_11796 [Fonsecaea erecta]|uniref:CCHC-type domain-containing protein n=1 Tax=Fonsecaea erecta TaxID=1367422 RepID=A0A178Z3J8_9EURO|nr:hypothetical protein AYL99_11796 [Fonsecaea erecta]OAP54036.1 hypothetical protein AYL99_11796 [Fonsecaea erecta]